MYIMAQTRSQRAAALAKRRLYRKRVKNSTCRGAKPYKCATKAQCKFTKGKNVHIAVRQRIQLLRNKYIRKSCNINQLFDITILDSVKFI